MFPPVYMVRRTKTIRVHTKECASQVPVLMDVSKLHIFRFSYIGKQNKRSQQHMYRMVLTAR